MELAHPAYLLQNNVIEHIFHLLGYSDGKFFVQPTKLRLSPVIDAVICNLSPVRAPTLCLSIAMANERSHGRDV